VITARTVLLVHSSMPSARAPPFYAGELPPWPLAL
jgi:hypothetical protein